MATRVLLTIDTELTWRHHRDGDWEGNYARSVEAAGVGISYQLEVLAAHGLKACFFVDPMPALLFGPAPVERMVAPILAAGQEVQLHLHPFWADLARGADRDLTFELNALPAARQEELIATARDLLMQAGAPEPFAFRAGSYAADRRTLAALARLGFRYDSSHNGCERPISAVPLPRHAIAPAQVEGLTEVPVGQVEERPGRLRHLQLCAISSSELRAALLHAGRHRHPVVTIVSHSFELATRDGTRPNRLLQRRFLNLCRFLAGRRQDFPTASFADLDDVPIDAAAAPAPIPAGRRYGRLASQWWGSTRYERPGEALTATSGGGWTSFEMVLPYVL